MYFAVECYTPPDVRRALVDYRPDRPPGEMFLRSWSKGQRFQSAPPQPLVGTIPTSQAGQLLDLELGPLPLMTHRLADVLRAAAGDCIDFYPAEVHDEATGTVLLTHVAFNLIARQETPAMLMCRGREGVMVVHASVRDAIEASGIVLDYDAYR